MSDHGLEITTFDLTRFTTAELQRIHIDVTEILYSRDGMYEEQVTTFDESQLLPLNDNYLTFTKK